MMNRILAMLLALCMVCCMTAASAEAVDATASATMTVTWSEEDTPYADWAYAHGFVYKPEENGYVKSAPDITSSATLAKQGGVNFGAIEWDADLQKAAIREFLKGGRYLGDPSFAQDETGYNYREMYQMATSYNNRPSNTNLELVLDAASLHLVGISEGGTGKTLQFQQNPYVSISWCRQLRIEEEEVYNYYCSYGVQYDGIVKVYGPDDLATPEGEEALLNLYDCYYPTLATSWAGYAAAFAGLTDAAEIRAAKLGYITNALNGGAMVVYEIVPTSIVITAPFLMNMSPTMANAARFTTAMEGEPKYAYTLCLNDSFIDKLIEYKNAFMATEEGAALVEAYYTTGMFPMLDQYCAAYGAPTSLQLAQMPNNAAGLKTQTTYIPE